MIDTEWEQAMSEHTDIHTTLAERGTKHGDFAVHARITQRIKEAMMDSPNWSILPSTMKEALEMDAHKTGRILAGDPNYHDHWHDKVGYITLVADKLVAPANAHLMTSIQQRDHLAALLQYVPDELCMERFDGNHTCVRKKGHEGSHARYGIGR